MPLFNACWQPIPPRQCKALDSALQRFKGEKYYDFNCLQFILNALNAVRGNPIYVDPNLTLEGLTWVPIRKLMRQYEIDIVPHVFLEPGDIVIFSEDSNEGKHAVMVGAKHNTVWHSTEEKGVHEGHIQDVSDGFSSSTICRPKDKELWTT